MPDEPTESGAPPQDAAAQDQSPEKTQEPTSESKPEGDKARETEPEESTGIRLPGVAGSGDAKDLFPELPRKGRDGKFVSKAEAEKQAEDEMREERDSFFGKQEEPAPEEKKVVPEPPPGAEQKSDSAEKYTFAGKEYESKEAAEQNTRSMQGMHKAMIDRESVAIDSAHQWRNYALEAEKKPVSPAPQDPTAPTALNVQQILSGVNGEMFEKIAQDPEKGLPHAGRFLAAQVLDAVHSQLLPAMREQIMAEMNKGMAPVREQQAFDKATKEVSDVFTAARGLRLSSGAPAFPELDDPATMEKVGRMWSEMDMPAEIATTPRGLQQAIALYRMKFGQPTAPKNELVPVPDEPTVQPTAAATTSGGQSTPTLGSTRSTPDSIFSKGLDDADLVDKNLGFAVRRQRR